MKIPLKVPLTCFFLSIVLRISCFAVSAVTVSQVSFDKVGRNDWLRSRFHISCDRNPTADAANSRFLDDIEAELFLSFRTSTGGFSYYSSRLEMVTIKQNQRYLLDFYLPGQVMERDQLRTIPFAYFIQFSVGGFSIPFDPEYGSSNMQNESARRVFLDRASEALNHNAGILVPSYHAPTYLTLEDQEQYPPFKRNPIAE